VKKRDSIVLVVCVVALGALIFLEPSYGWKLRSWLTPQAPPASSQTSDPTLEAQNQSLEAQLAVLQGVANELPHVPSGYIPAMVYSRYPLNFKSELLVNAGSDEGVAVGKAVVFQGVLIGIVEKVFGGSSLVQTVFDENLKTPVRIGSKGYDGLLSGGADPEITSIQKGEPIATGDIVYSAAPSFSYGLPVAVVAATGTTSDGLFEDATLSFAYDINDIQTVLIAQ
jgi:rod shape-determining protein MreC